MVSRSIPSTSVFSFHLLFPFIFIFQFGLQRVSEEIIVPDPRIAKLGISVVSMTRSVGEYYTFHYPFKVSSKEYTPLFSNMF